MVKIEKELLARFQTRPHDTARLIVRIQGDWAQAMSRLAELQVTVLGSFHLINAVAISCPGETALAVLREPWVQAIEEDRQVFAQSPTNGSQRGQDEQQQDQRGATAGHGSARGAT